MDKHEHEHDAHCGCGCGHDHDHHHHHHAHEEIEILPVEGMTVLQQNMLLGLSARRYLPVCAFALGVSGNDDAQMMALAPVYIGAVTDTLEQIKALGAELSQLESGGLISLDYDVPLDGYAYAEYDGSEAYAYFVSTVREAASLPERTFDTPALLHGSMALTEAGEAAVAAMVGL